MNLVISFMSIFPLLIKVCALNFGFDGCFITTNRPETIKLRCKNFENDFKPNCTTAFNRSAIRTVKLDCERSLGFLSLDPNLFARLPKVRAVDVSNLSITDFSIDSHKNVISGRIQATNLPLTALNASHNQLTHFQLARMPNLTDIDFSFNKLTSLKSADFDGSFQLSAINFSNNAISILEPSVFAKHRFLSTLDLSHNKIVKLDRSLLMNNLKMQFLNIRHNPLAHFNFNIFSPNVKSIVVRLPSRSIETLDVSCRRTNCLFNRFDEEDYFENLQHFNISGNQFGNLFAFFEKLGENVRTMDLSRNFVNELNGTALKKLTNLKQLRISHANLSQIEADAFDHQPKLKLLDLSYNRLGNEDTSFLFRSFLNLETLNLEGNQFTAIDFVVPDRFPNLTALHISRNRFSCEYLEKYLRKWENVQNFRFVSNPMDFQSNINGIDCYYEPTNDRKTSKIGDLFHLNAFNLIVITIFIIVLLCILSVFIILQACRTSNTHKKETQIQNIEIMTKNCYPNADVQSVNAQNVGTQRVSAQNVGIKSLSVQNVGTQNVGIQSVGTQRVGTQNRGTQFNNIDPSKNETFSHELDDSEPDYDEIDEPNTLFARDRQAIPGIFENRLLPMPPIEHNPHRYGRIRNYSLSETTTVSPYAYARVIKGEFI